MSMSERYRRHTSGPPGGSVSSLSSLSATDTDLSDTSSIRSNTPSTSDTGSHYAGEWTPDAINRPAYRQYHDTQFENDLAEYGGLPSVWDPIRRHDNNHHRIFGQQVLENAGLPSVWDPNSGRDDIQASGSGTYADSDLASGSGSDFSRSSSMIGYSGSAGYTSFDRSFTESDARSTYGSDSLSADTGSTMSLPSYLAWSMDGNTSARSPLSLDSAQSTVPVDSEVTSSTISTSSDGYFSSRGTSGAALNSQPAATATGTFGSGRTATSGFPYPAYASSVVSIDDIDDDDEDVPIIQTRHWKYLQRRANPAAKIQITDSTQDTSVYTMQGILDSSEYADLQRRLRRLRYEPSTASSGVTSMSETGDGYGSYTGSVSDLSSVLSTRPSLPYRTELPMGRKDRPLSTLSSGAYSDYSSWNPLNGRLSGGGRPNNTSYGSSVDGGVQGSSDDASARLRSESSAARDRSMATTGLRATMLSKFHRLTAKMRFGRGRAD